MEKAFIYSILIILLLWVIWHIFCNLMIVFHKDTTNACVKAVLKDPYTYITCKEMCNFMRNMVYLFFICIFLFATYNGNLKIKRISKNIEVISKI